MIVFENEISLAVFCTSIILVQNTASEISVTEICIGNSMICSDVWHTYHEGHFKIVIRN